MSRTAELKKRLKALQDGRNRLAAELGTGRIKDKKKRAQAIKHGENITKDIKLLKKQLKNTRYVDKK